MGKLVLPGYISQLRKVRSLRICPAHRAWVRKHYCCVPGCKRMPVQCAHVRNGTDGGMGMKPSDKWAISLCDYHHLEQHSIGEAAFQDRYDIDLVDLAREFARRSPFKLKLGRFSQECDGP
jgi:hypothetical protein